MQSRFPRVSSLEQADRESMGEDDGTVRQPVRSSPPRDSTATAGIAPDVRAEQASTSLEHPQQSNRAVPQWKPGFVESGEATPSGRPTSPREAMSGASSPEELLRRLSLTDQRSKLTQTTQKKPRKGHPGLELSGNVISATFCVPYKIDYGSEREWKLNPRRGSSAMFESFSYLASEKSQWRHTLVGWPGEIDRIRERGSKAWKVTASATSMDTAPLNKASAPIPVSAREASVLLHEATEIRIPATDRQKLKKQVEQKHGGKVELVWLTDETDDDGTITLRNQHRWRRYGEHELFTLFHYKQNEPSDGRAMKKSWRWYEKMNQAFADAIISIYKPGDVVLVHDYQLMLLPSMLRQRLANMYIGFFLHIPFPSSEYYRSLTMRNEILEGVLGANLIGFQAFSYSRHFSSCCTRILGLESSPAGVEFDGVHVAVDIFPIGIDTDLTLKSAFADPDIDKEVVALRAKHTGKKIIVGRDRLDSVRGVAQKLQAFEIFLERHPEWHDKVVLIQVTSPTSIEDREERREKTENKIADLVARINGNFGSLSFTPVEHYAQYLTQNEYFALLRIADLGLITSVRDGMNTTALEYILCQRDNQGPLIISEFSGTAGSLSDALHINPWDLSGVAETIDRALTMSEEEKEEAHQNLYNYVTANNVQSWTDNFIQRLLTNLAAFDQTKTTPVLDRGKLLHRYRNSSRRLFLFDYDGTLTPIVRDPEAAIPSDRVIRTLKTLASDPKNSVWIISGRDQKFLDEWMGHISSLGLSAEHGSFVRMPTARDSSTSASWDNLTEKFDMGWQNEVLEVFERYSEHTSGSFIERKKIAITWHYRRADPEWGSFQAQNCQMELERGIAMKWDVEVMTGKANVEVRPKFVNKGEIVRRLVKAYGDGEDEMPDFVLCLGDDHTDEDMFRSLRASSLKEDHVFAVTIGAGAKQTLAKWHLTEPPDVIAAIRLLNSSGDPSVTADDASEAQA